MEFKFQRTRIDKISRDKIISELEKAAKKFNYLEFGMKDFSKNSEISHGTVIREFGTWKKSLQFLKSQLKQRGKDLLPRTVPPNQVHSDKKLFDEMERVWNQLGHRPSNHEWNSIQSKISHATYMRRFGGWTNACLKFIEYKMGSEVINDSLPQREEPAEKKIKPEPKNKEDKREIPLRLRLAVLKRDNFCCVFCGKSPALNQGVILHIDHKIPFSKGGKSTADNLQTLCSDCNLGKGNLLLSHTHFEKE